ncbi:MAG: dihydroorotate dehydrogenase electron transfer subunit [Acidobacteriota bacterium]|nr:dihydroorotate dehydrogenase electron transfer subunit [Acidobacteriota bacterium]MDQ3417879.1 dihydroorotate dehydrogenase electron transfer subunit [Acidobacteriota bacterium]
MPVDIDAAVIGNTRLSEDYSVLALAAPEIATAARPGQFVMLKTSRGMDPLLRRPFSIFEVLRNPDGSPRGITILNKRIGTGTGLLYDLEAGARVQCLGPLGVPFEPAEAPAQAWMVAGGVGLAPFVTLAEALIARRTPLTLFYGARRAADLHCADIFERLGVPIVYSTEDGSRGSRGFITVPLEARLASLESSEDVRLYVCGPTPMMRAVADVAALHGRRCDVSLEQVMGCGMGGCYSCVVPARDATGAPHHTRSCIDGPVFDASRIVWDALAH